MFKSTSGKIVFVVIYPNLRGCGGIGRHASLRSVGRGLTIRQQANQLATPVKNVTQRLSKGKNGVQTERRNPVNWLGVI